MPTPNHGRGHDRRFHISLPNLWQVSCIVRGWDWMAKEEHLADSETYESPFIACLESALIRLKEGSYLHLCFKRWALPFPRTGCAPRAGKSLTSASSRCQSLRSQQQAGVNYAHAAAATIYISPFFAWFSR